MRLETTADVLELLTDGDIGLSYHDILCGDNIGAGQFRTVYECAINPKLVVKIQHDKDVHSNMMEWEIWEYVKYTEYAKWFAPCERITDNGRILLQHKTKPFPDTFQFPDRIPHFFTDVYKRNFGLYKGHMVAHDYDYTFYRFGFSGLNNKTQKLKWWI